MKFIACDIETTGLNFLTDKILCIGFSTGEFFDATEISKAAPLFKQHPVLAMHNGSFDTKFLWAADLTAAENTFDTMVAAYLLKDRPAKLSLDACVSYYLGRPSWKDDIKTGAVFSDPELLKDYCLQDCALTAELASVLYQRLEEEGQLQFFWHLMELRRMLTRAEYRGVTLNTDAANKLIETLTTTENYLNTSLQSLAEPYIEQYKKETGKKSFNFNSPAQVLWLLKRLGFNTVHPLTKKESSDILILETYADQSDILRELIKLRKTKKKKKSIEGYIEDQNKETLRIYPNFNCTNTRTGRISASGPNLMQIDRTGEVRSLFTAAPGMSLVVGDLAQIEVRMAAHYSADQILINMFNRGEDFYGTLAREVLGSPHAPNELKEKQPELRHIAKTIGLSVLYGVGVNKLREFIKIKAGHEFTPTQTRSIISSYFIRFSGLRDLQKRVHDKIVKDGFLTNLFGRKLFLSESDIVMKGVNSLLQSSASDLLLFRTLEAEKLVPWARLLLTVHDEVIFECPKGREQELINIIKPVYERTRDIEFNVPLKMEFEFGPDWACK